VLSSMMVHGAPVWLLAGLAACSATAEGLVLSILRGASRCKKT
jgi:hypothetical protein